MELTPNQVKHPNFISNKRIYVVKCQLCKTENYAPSVAHSFCAQCGEFYELKEATIAQSDNPTRL